MKKLTFILVLAVLLGGSALAAMSTPSYAQAYQYPSRPGDPYARPWVGPDTPWVYYNGDWFLNGLLYNFFGNQYGWAPYYAYPPTYIVRPNDWYAPRWHAWYQGHPHYWNNFQRQYPYWRRHHVGQHYDQNFYNQHHRGQGAGWQKGFQGRAMERRHPDGQRPGPGHVAPSEGRGQKERQHPQQQQQQQRQHEQQMQQQRQQQKPQVQPMQQQQQQHEQSKQRQQQPDKKKQQQPE